MTVVAGYVSSLKPDRLLLLAASGAADNLQQAVHLAGRAPGQSGLTSLVGRCVVLLLPLLLLPVSALPVSAEPNAVRADRRRGVLVLAYPTEEDPRSGQARQPQERLDLVIRIAALDERFAARRSQPRRVPGTAQAGQATAP